MSASEPRLPGSPRGDAQGRRRRPWTLRRRLTVTVATLLVLASILIGFVSVFALQSFLTERLDAQLAFALERSQAAVNPNNGNNGNSGNSGNSNNSGNSGKPNKSNNSGNSGNSNDSNDSGNSDRDNDNDNTQGALRAPGQSAGMLVAVTTASGPVVAGILDRRGNPQIVPDGTLTAQNILQATRAGSRPFTLETKGAGAFRAVSAASGTQLLIIGLPLEEVNAATTQLITIILIVTVVGVGAAILAGRFLVRWELRPLERVADTATRVSQLPLASGNVTIT
ncbi:MAG: hypothetical protein F2808_05990, partial [Actinobacteria bacterium]|nr:hypothetical protein [Actinomycetota bacterium]